MKISDNVENSILRHLVDLRNDVATLRSEMKTEFSDVKSRISGVEYQLVGVRGKQRFIGLWRRFWNIANAVNEY